MRSADAEHDERPRLERRQRPRRRHHRGPTPTAQSVFALGGVFSNNVLLGVPLARLLIGPAAMPSVALILVFNALTLWTLVTVSVEWARHGALSLSGLRKTAIQVLKNPIVIAILSGTLFGLTGLALPAPLEQALSAVGHLAGPARAPGARARHQPVWPHERLARERGHLRAQAAGAAPRRVDARPRARAAAA